MTITKAGLAALILLLIGAQACSTVVHGTTQELRINTVPPGARATIGTQTCVTPCKLTVKRDEKSLRIEKGGYKKTIELEKEFLFSATICGNICWVEIGAIVDLATGGAWEIKPVNLRLDASDEGAHRAPGRE